jgi:hypothetical protein
MKTSCIAKEYKIPFEFKMALCSFRDLELEIQYFRQQHLPFSNQIFARYQIDLEHYYQTFAKMETLICW